VGFKGSKAQFGDLYASGFLGGGNNPVGDGVRVQDVKQSFGQGNISFTDNGLDLAINGDGFFVLNNGGEVRYSRAGQFGIDKDGFVTNNQNMRVQGFVDDDAGNLSGIRDDLQVETGNLAPARTTSLRTDVNLDSRETVLEQQVRNWNSLDVNEFQGQTVRFGYDGQADEVASFDAAANVSDIVAGLESVPGVSASASTSLSLGTLSSPDYSTFQLTVGDETNPREIDTDGVTTLGGLADRINQSSSTSIFAFVDAGELNITHNSGETLEANIEDPAGSGTIVSVEETGQVSINTDRTVTSVSAFETGTPTNTSTAIEGAYNVTPTAINAFNPADQRTYNHATSTTIYDSLGNSHEMTQFYVKQPSPGNGVGVSEWAVYAQIDGEFVAGTDQSPYLARFNQDGLLDSVNGDPNGEILIDDWIPKDAQGLPNGADGPPAPGVDITTPIPDPPTTSAFVLDLGNTTQYGSEFGVNDQRQNGYTTGRLSGLDVSDQGVLFARYTNGQSQSLGQVALASFSNTNGLSPVGETTWVETFESGQPIIGAPDTGTLGSIKASSVE
jgi:flagellar hook protein FlgE